MTANKCSRALWQTFLRAHRAGRGPRAWLVCGDNALASSILQALLDNGEDCSDVPPDSACPQVGAQSPYVREINRQDSVQSVREKLGCFLYTCGEGRVRVCLLNDLDKYSIYVHNALLKTLEEAPDHTYFVATADNPCFIPKTVLSRFRLLEACEHVEIRRDEGTLPVQTRNHEVALRLWSSCLDGASVQTWIKDFYTVTQSTADMHEACRVLIDFLAERAREESDASLAAQVLDMVDLTHRAQSLNISAKSLFFEIGNRLGMV